MSDSVYVVLSMKYTDDIPLGCPKPVIVFKNEHDAKFLVENSRPNQNGERYVFSYVKVLAY